MITLNLHYKSDKKFSRRCAFTLAELMIVMAIIAVLVGISIPIFMGQLEKSKEATDVADMRAAKSLAVELFYAGVTDKASAQANGLQRSLFIHGRQALHHRRMEIRRRRLCQRCIRQEDRNGYFP